MSTAQPSATMLQPQRAPLRQRSIETLEFPRVLERLAALTSFSLGRERALALRPSARLRDVRWRLRTTAEARFLLAQRALNLGGVVDVREAAHRAAKGASLDPGTLLDIAATLETARTVRNTLDRFAERVPTLHRLSERLHPLPELVALIRRSISMRGEVMDSASPLLGPLRRELRAAHDRLLKRLNTLLALGQEEGWLQDAIITQRRERYVLPVKAEFRSYVPGIVHDVSHSGATLFIEPLETVELGNAWVEAQMAERREVERVLQHLGHEVGAAAPQVIETVEALADLDLALAKARLAEAQDAVIPEVVPRGEYPGPRPSLLLRDARHPLLPVRPVPITLEVGGDFTVLLISGPNTGGKTVALKTAGLLVLMAQAGLAIPAAEGSRVPLFDGVFADIGDEQSIVQSLSTFSSHLGNIVAALREATERSLVLLDELAAGTDPIEGSALARALLLHLKERGATVIATTHHGELKALVQATPGMQNASVEFDPETLAPTYRLVQGLPGPSNAFIIAERLGLPAPILEQARALLSPSDQAVGALLASLAEEQRRAQELRQALERQREEVQRLQDELHARLQQLADEEARLLEAARQQALERVAEVERELERLLHKWAVPPRTEAQREAAMRQLEALRQQIARRFGTRPPIPQPALRQGARVRVPALHSEGRVLEPPDEQGRLIVQVGTLRLNLSAQEVEPLSQPSPKRGQHAVSPQQPSAVAPAGAAELDVRGLRADEVSQEIERALNDAFLARQPQLRIIHGLGTGALRQAVRSHLRSHPLVRSFSPGGPHQGGEGVTLVEINV